ncbi:MAG: 2-hydroxyhepta-2,4-diene-1,7-dioate isomerase [Oceanobacter sp.]|jgi:2-keto-4-pentenoate hydratase/2-oxohepta-3-ene-1,7-dioic acid hydratase in catechol pathway|nr:MAG: 2-hydroxyhepta-2,4-diene-1,7-dioate isomerase [Oceanobacter sp.]|tara:strand:+ start:3420 stop:4394 length:975 start_codon:yes stop_codon:yes gene_type:complete
MKLVTFDDSAGRGPKRIGAVLDNNVIDLNAALASRLATGATIERAAIMANAAIPDDMVAFLAGGPASMDQAKSALEHSANADEGTDGQPIERSLSKVRLLAPVPRPASIRDTISFEGHMRAFERRTGKTTPDLWYDRPIYYKGNPATVVGPEAEIRWPAYAEKLDYELEFGIIVGKTGCDVAEADAHSHIAGYLIFNDFSARDVIPGEVSVNLGPSKGKDFDTGNAMGPWLVTPDEIDASNLNMTARINGETWSEGNSSDMYWTFEQMIAFMSQSETLHPGDFIGSGTVENGCGDEMDKWLSPGNVVELEVDGLGLLRNTISSR